MSYDFRLLVPAAERRKGKKGWSPAQLQRLRRAREIFLAHEPGLVIEEGEDVLSVSSAEIGDVVVQPHRICAAFSMGSEPRSLYAAIHGLMKRFEGEGYEAEDMQHPGPLHYAADFGEFMQQYRADMRCTDEEFAMWLRGETPPWWAERDRLLETGGAAAAVAFPRCCGVPWNDCDADARTLDEQYAHLLDIVRGNDAAIEAHGLHAYLRACSEQQACSDVWFFGHRRLDGSWYPNSGEAGWMRGSLLDYELGLLAYLQSRGYPGLVRDTPQHVALVFAWPMPSAANQAQHDARIALEASLRADIRAAGLALHGGGGHMRGGEATYEYYCDDAQALFDLIEPKLRAAPETRPLSAWLRHGDVGARTSVVDLR